MRPPGCPRNPSRENRGGNHVSFRVEFQFDATHTLRVEFLAAIRSIAFPRARRYLSDAPVAVMSAPLQTHL